MGLVFPMVISCQWYKIIENVVEKETEPKKTWSVSKREIIIISCRKFIVHTEKVWRCVKNTNSSCIYLHVRLILSLIQSLILYGMRNYYQKIMLVWSGICIDIPPFLSRIIKHSRSSKIPAVICRSLIWGLCSLVIFFNHQHALVYNRSDNSFWSSFLSWGHFQQTFYNFWLYILLKIQEKRC